MEVVSLFWNPIWPPRRHVNLLHSTLFVSAKTGNKDKGVPRGWELIFCDEYIACIDCVAGGILS